MPTEFQKRVWDALRLIPRGRVTTYSEIARYLGTDAVRAVGTAVGKNPDAPVIPCHRVVPATGKIGNYSGGRPRLPCWLKRGWRCVRGGSLILTSGTGVTLHIR